MARESQPACLRPDRRASRCGRRLALSLFLALLVPAFGSSDGDQADGIARLLPAHTKPTGGLEVRDGEADAGHGDSATEEGIFVKHSGAADDERPAGEAEEGEGEGGAESEEVEGERSEGSEELKHIDISIGCMLLGSIAIQMGLLYLLYHPDEDIMKSSWEVISMTVSIFVAVLIFHSVEGVADALEENEHNKLEGSIRAFAHIVISLICFLMCFVFMQLIIALEATAERDETAIVEGTMPMMRQTSVNPSNLSVPVCIGETPKQMHKRITKSWAILLSHIAAFAGIHMGVCVQSLDFLAGVRASTLLVPALLGGLLFPLFRLADWFRGIYSTKLTFDAHAEWDEEAEEAEMDIATIAISFLTIQAIRFCISGVLPHSTGMEEPQKAHPWYCIVILLLVGIVFYLLTATMVAFIACEAREEMIRASDAEDAAGKVRGSLRGTLLLSDIDHSAHTGLDPMNVYVSRWYKVIPKILASSGSWCLLWACVWVQPWFPQVTGLHFPPNSTAMLVVLSLFISLVMFLFIMVLDYVADLQATGPICDVTIRAVIDSLGILVGFTWELSFNSGLEGIAELAECYGRWGPLAAEILLAVIISIIVIPAWRANILRRVLTLRELELERVAENAGWREAYLSQENLSLELPGPLNRGNRSRPMTRHLTLYADQDINLSSVEESSAGDRRRTRQVSVDTSEAGSTEI